MRGSLWRKGRQGLNEVKLGHPFHEHRHSHNDCQESPVYYCWSHHYPETNKSKHAWEKENKESGGRRMRVKIMSKKGIEK